MIREFFKCEKGGRLVEIVVDNPSSGILECDELPMVLQLPHDGPGGEKHIPIVTKTERGYLVSVGGVPHPMSPEHYIQWIQLEVSGVLHRAQLLPSSEPSFEFEIGDQGDKYLATIYCNLHGLWDNLSSVNEVPVAIDDRGFKRTDPALYTRT